MDGTTLYPAPRDIPHGKILVCDHPAKEDMARDKILATGVHKISGREVMLYWTSPGFRVAGSSCRWSNATYTVSHRPSNGASYGQTFLGDSEGEAEAKAGFESCIRPEA